MDSSSANPFLVALFCVARCMIPLLIMLGISYLLRRFGLIAEPPKPPPEQNNGNNLANSGEGGRSHGNA